MKNKQVSRRNFLLKGLFKKVAMLSPMTWFLNDAPNPNEKIRMLTADGDLVEIDKKLINEHAREADLEEIKNWIQGSG